MFYFVVVGEDVLSLMNLDSYGINLKNKLLRTRYTYEIYLRRNLYFEEPLAFFRDAEMLLEECMTSSKNV